MENLPSILTPDLGLLFWMLLAFVVVFLVPAILNMVDSRNRFINDNLRKAKEAAERLEHIKDEGESILQEAREKQAAIIKEATATRDAIIEEAQEKARVEGARLIEDAKAEIESQKQAAISDIRRQVAELSIEISEKILKDKLGDDKAQMEYIDRILDEVTSK